MDIRQIIEEIGATLLAEKRVELGAAKIYRMGLSESWDRAMDLGLEDQADLIGQLLDEATEKVQDLRAEYRDLGGSPLGD